MTLGPTPVRYGFREFYWGEDAMRVTAGPAYTASPIQSSTATYTTSAPNFAQQNPGATESYHFGGWIVDPRWLSGYDVTIYFHGIAVNAPGASTETIQFDVGLRSLTTGDAAAANAPTRPHSVSGQVGHTTANDITIITGTLTAVAITPGGYGQLDIDCNSGTYTGNFRCTRVGLRYRIVG